MPPPPHHLSCASSNYLACSFGRQGKWIGTQHLLSRLIFSFAAWRDSVIYYQRGSPQIYRLIPRANAWLAKDDTPRMVGLCRATPSFDLQARKEIMLQLRPVSISSTYNGNHSRFVPTLHATNIKRSSILQRDFPCKRKETAAALQKTCLQWYACQWWICAQIGCPIISVITSVWTQTPTSSFK